MGEPCFRCDAVLEPLDSPEEITFFACPRCHRQYARKAGQGITDRWGSPISIALYPIIFSTQPAELADHVARLFLDGRTALEMPAELAQLVADIRDELERPKQRVRDILDVAGCEDDVRAFLRLLAERIAAALDKKR